MKKGKSTRSAKKQRYFCKDCQSYFQTKSRPQKLEQIIIDKYVEKRQTLKNLSYEYGKCINWVRTKIEKAKAIKKKTMPDGLVFVADCTFFGRAYGFLVFRAPELKRNLYFKPVMFETINEYLMGRITLENQGFKFKAIVLDGRPGVRNLFLDIPVQMCHFHQKQIIQRYLTLNPKLEAGIELKAISDTLTYATEKEFTQKLLLWHQKWQEFLKERTTDQITNKWHYTHKRTRAAFRSLKTNLPHLFTYLKYPELNIPTTTNSLEGSFSWLKQKVNIHRGFTKELKDKIIAYILQN